MSNFFALFLFAFIASLSFSSCKKDKTTGINYTGVWTVNYNYTTGSLAKGTFKATLKSNGSWDYVEGSNSKTDAGTWTGTDNSLSFEFNFSGKAKYPATSVSANTLTGTAVADAGVSTGTWTATK